MTREQPPPPAWLYDEVRHFGLADYVVLGVWNRALAEGVLVRGDELDPPFIDPPVLALSVARIGADVTR